MLSRDEFIDFILEGPDDSSLVVSSTTAESALPAGFEGFEGFDTTPVQLSQPQPGSSFARRLLEASGFGYAEMVERKNVIRSSDAVAKHLPERVSYWPQTPSRKYYTLLFETDLTHKQLLAIPAFKSRKLAHLDIVEDALARLVSEALDGFQRGGEGVTADVRKGSKEETLCVVSILDEREGAPVRLVCFGTQNKATGGLETFQITEQTRTWDPQLAREHLGLLYERQFKKLEGQAWQEAFTTTEERKQADSLLEVCTGKAPTERDIQEKVLDLLDTIAKGFGLKKRAKAQRRLQAFALPADHDIGIDPKKRESSFGGINPFGGISLRDERSRLLGYIVYPLSSKSDAKLLQKHLKKNNRFHNVLVVYPDKDHAKIELWQGREQLKGKLRKGKGYKDAADVVNLLSRFFVVSKAKVKNPTELAQELAYRAQYLRRLAVKQLEDEPEEGPLRNLYNAFKEALVHDQTEEEFADAFAQTITYGLLTARWTGNDELIAKGERFTRQTALEHLPASSPFLNDLFKSALSVRLEEQRGRLLWLVDDIADLLDRVDVTYVFGIGDKDSGTEMDPVIHFYEPFLAAYDKKLKNKRGVFFTPRPVVSYIVRSVHEVLQKEFGLEDGLASTDTWGDVAKRMKGIKIPEGVKASDPFVCILDPATGTGTFLFECIEVIEQTMKERWCKELKRTEWKDQTVVSRWSEYVIKYLLPRLYGYELMMASYAVAHLKLSFKIQETGHRLDPSARLNVYLTNSLEPPTDSAQQRLSGVLDALAHEAAAVNEIKRHKRFTVVIGNPPYSNYGQLNRSLFILNLLEDYKRGLNEKKLNLDDDFIKFVRLAQWLVSMTGQGIAGLITNHTYLDGLTHRQMRKGLISTFSQISVMDLHGNSRKSERAPDGSIDENVFDIMQGVAISLLRRSGLTDEEPEVQHLDCWGSRESKYRCLEKTSVSTTKWTTLCPAEPNYFYVAKDFAGSDAYHSWPKITDIFSLSGCGFATSRDKFVTDLDSDVLGARIQSYFKTQGNEKEISERFGIRSYEGFSVAGFKQSRSFDWKNIRRFFYRPFDDRFVYYAQFIVQRWQRNVMQHLGHNTALALVTTRFTKGEIPCHFFATRLMVEKISLSNKTSNNAFTFPLYTLADGSDGQSLLLEEVHSQPNFAASFMRKLAFALGLPQKGEHGLPAGLTPEDIFHYAYAVFHSPVYRSHYSEFLKIDFPRLPLTGDLELFRAMARLGVELTGLHLLESPRLDQPCTDFIGSRNPEIAKVSWTLDTVWIDKSQTTGFRGVREPMWNFHIGGYKVCEKWLKDRKGRTLSKEDIEHYQKIVVAISETIRHMKEIDEVIGKHGGWPGAFAAKTGGGKK